MDTQKNSKNKQKQDKPKNKNKAINSKNHDLNLVNRKKLNIDGIDEVISYNEAKILLKTTMGTLNIKGKNLNIEQLNLEQNKIKISGKNITSLEYTNKNPNQNIIKKIFK